MIDPAILIVIFLGIFVVLLLLALSKISEPEREYGVKSVTLRGEEVRSIAERKIADYFAKNNISYVYEQEAKVKGWFFDHIISSPDFYLPDYDVYVEYWGLVNADDNTIRERYIQNMKRKMAIYYQNNIKFISIYPDNLNDLDWIFRRKFKEVTGFEISQSKKTD